MERMLFAVMVIASLASRILGTETEGCQSPQYLKIGGTGVVHCFFNPSFYGVLWFNSTEANLGNPFLKLVGSEKSGEMRNYDIYPNGSLIIKKVLPVHDQTFTVVKFASESEPPVPFSVVVITTVIPKIGFPVVAECGTEQRSCYTQLDASSEVNCFVRDSRPAVSLTWFLQTAKLDRNISSLINVTILPRNDTATYTSHAIARNLFKYSTLLNLLVCKANDLSGMLSEYESYVLIENRDIALNTKPVKIFIEHDAQLQLSCSDLKADIIVWKKQEHFGGNFKILAYSYLLKNNLSKIFDDHYTLDEDGSLIVSHPHKKEGTYECSLQKGHTGEKNIFVVNVEQTSDKQQFLWVLLFIVILLGVVGIISFTIYTIFKNRRLQPKSKNIEAQNMDTPDVTSPLMDQLPDERSQKQIDYTETDEGQGVLVDKISAQESSHSDQFLKELKAMYELQYRSLQPTNTKLCVNDVFVHPRYKLHTFSPNSTDPNSEDIKTYKELLQKIVNPSLAVIEGGVGCGKTTLSLQLAYDWCNSTANSPVHDNEMFILLKVRDIGSETSVYKAIKKHILPRNSRLSDKNIKDLLSTCRSGVIILDGFDKSMDLFNGEESDIMDIVRGKMFQNYLVLITTRSFFSLKSDLPPQSHYVKLMGLDEEAKDQYIRKVVATRDSLEMEKIKQCLYNVSVATDLLKIPLLFTTSAHISVQQGGFRNFSSLSKLVRFMIYCLHNHLGRKRMKKFGNRETSKQYRLQHKELDEIAFKIASGQRRPSWNRNKFCKKVGKEFYLYYNRVGILVENAYPNLGTIEPVREVQFSHKLFCDWYAAHCLVQKSEESELEFQEIEKTIQFFNIRNVFLLACGISDNFAERVTKYLVESKICDNFATLCYLELAGNDDKILNEVKQLFASEVTLTNNQDKLLSWSTIQLSTIASQNKFPIARLYLKSCKSPMEFSEGVLDLQDDICLPKLATLKQLVFSEFLDMQTKDEMHILEYSSMCQNIESVMFYHCTVAKTVQDSCLSALKSRDIKVLWETANSTFYMNLQSGIWEHGGTPLSDDEYFKEIDGILHHSGGEQPP